MYEAGYNMAARDDWRGYRKGDATIKNYEDALDYAEDWFDQHGAEYLEFFDEWDEDEWITGYADYIMEIEGGAK